ncbi:response regulator [Burkholderia glumae]|uniref:response regulator n=1 Tax=Burkholderia glumae TaxID=337 RepID=UPI003B9BDD0C
MDDNEDALNAMAMLLCNYETRVAKDGGAALEIAEQFVADVAFLDIDLPDMSGYELARGLRRCRGTAAAKFVALSGFGAAEDISHSIEEGFDRHLTKPVPPQELIDYLSRLER